MLREERKAEGSKQESIYSYDGFNRQKKIINFESKVQVNHYDGEGLPHEMEENGKLVKFLYADREAVAEEKEDTYYGNGRNLYAYYRNLPLGYKDPSGHYPCQEKQDLYKKYRENARVEVTNAVANYDLIRKNQGEAAANTYLRSQQAYMGATPSKNSKTGNVVIERMKNEGKIRTICGEMQFQASNDKWYPLSEADMVHIKDAVTW